MEDGNPKKPLRQPTNKAKDIYNTYLKHEGGKSSPVTFSEEKEKSVIDEHNEPNKTETNFVAEEAIDNSLVEKLKEEVNDLQNKLIQIEKEKNEFHEQLLRKAAEFENFRKRTQKEKEEIIKYANEKLLFEFLTILDDLGNAVTSAKQNSDFNALVTGLELIWNKTKKLFEQAGVSEIENPVGKPFDVEYHEALLTMPSELPEGYVVQELQKGYKYFDKVLRHTKVITSLGKVGGDGEEKQKSN
ncbi:MAG: nucleotide exchange factor GrpE [Ignavibacteria bacterium]|nr:nucleotide exchange factor GrpE [Ignavibacteria bacterium]